MAVFEKWFEQDLHKELKTRHCEGIVLTGDNLSNLIGVRLYEDGEPAALTGVVTLHAIRADGTTVVDNQGGTISGNAVSFTLKEACMAIPGPLVVLLRLTNGDVKTSILRAVFTVDISESGMIIDPGRVIPSIDELLAMLAEMEEAKDAANQAADDAEAAAASADTAAAAANAAANAANAAAGSVNTAISNAQAATTAANNAASAANTAAEGADDARDFAYAAGEDANGAANAAYTSASAADTAAAAANTAAQSATTAAAAANTAAEGADDAAGDANQAVDDLRQFMKQVTPADTATGRVITFEPTTEGPFIGLEVFGRCEQDTEPSPQLWPETGTAAATGEVSGVTVTGSANGGYAIQGTATADRYLYPNTGVLYDAAVTLEAGTYTVNASPGLMVSVRQWASDSIYSSIAYGNPATFTLAASQKITVNPVVPNGATVDITDGFVMLAAGEKAQAYQPYTGEITLPSPTHPRDIAVAGEGGTLHMGTVGENLAWMERGTLDASGAEVASTVAWRTGYLPIMGACVYASKFYLYTDASEGLAAHFFGAGMAYLGSETVLAYNEAQRATELSTVAAAAGALFVRFVQIFPTSSNTPDASQLMITFGDVGGEYPEYVRATGCRAALLIPGGLGLRGLPVSVNDPWNYQDTEGQYWICDVADYDAGVCTRRVGKTTFANLTRVTYSSSTGLFKSTSPSPTALFENHIMTRIYESVDNDYYPPALQDGQICAINTGAAVQWKDSRFTSVEDMLAAIGDEPIYYMLRSSSVTYMTDEQKNSFNALRSCNGITHAFAEDAARPYFTASVYSNFLEHLDETVEEAVQIAVSEAVEPIHDEVENIGERVDDLESYVRQMSPLATVGPADIVSIEDAAPLSAEGLKVDVEPKQDLHGYDHPWPAGGGVNLLVNFEPQTQTINGVTWTINSDGSITANGTASGASTLTVINDADGVGADLVGNFKYVNFPSVSASIIKIGIKIGASWFTVYPNFTVEINGANGKITQMWYQIMNGMTVNNITISPMIYKASDTTPSEWTPYSNICPITGWEGVTVTDEGESGDTRTASVSFPETIYGGTVDLATGECVVDRAMVALRQLTWYYNSSQRFFSTPLNDIVSGLDGDTVDTGIVIDRYAYKGAGIGWTNMPNCTFGVVNNSLRIRNESYTAITAFVNEQGDTEIVYPLATPTTFTLSPAELELFKSTNNISADAGKVTVTYRQDVFLTLNKRINELQALVLES